MKAEETVNAKQRRIGLEEALKMAAEASDIYVSKGSKVIHLTVGGEEPDEELVKKHILGPTGNLRAPTVLKGKTMLVGFNEDAYQKVLT